MLKQYFSDQTNRDKRITATVIVLGVAVIGTILLLSSHAATPATSINAASGSVVSPATTNTNCTGASNNSCVTFGSSTTTTGGSQTPVGAASTVCNYYASPSGSDSTGNGSMSKPYATLTKLDGALSPSSGKQTGCLETGTYGSINTEMFLDSEGTASNPLTITAAPGAAVQVDGFIEMNGQYNTLSDLTIDGANTFYSASSVSCNANDVSQALQVNGQYDIFEDNNFSQSSLRGVAIGVGYDGDSSVASGTTGNSIIIRDNRIHDVGACDAYDHTIYISHGSGALIYDNWMYNDPYGYGVQVYPDPMNAKIYANVIYNVGSGFSLGGDSSVTGNMIYNNVVANSTGLSETNPPASGAVQYWETGACLEVYWTSGAGSDNTFENNACFNNPQDASDSPNSSESGFSTVSGNDTTDNPDFTDAATDNFTVTNPKFASWGLWNGLYP